MSLRDLYESGDVGFITFVEAAAELANEWNENDAREMERT